MNCKNSGLVSYYSGHNNWQQFKMIRNINVSNNVENIPQLSNIVPMNNNWRFFVIYLFILKNEIQLFFIFYFIISIVEK